MNPRSRKYHESRKAEKTNKTIAAGKEDIVEQKPKAVKPVKKASASAEEPDEVIVSQKSSATQDDTGGGNDSGKRADDN